MSRWNDSVTLLPPAKAYQDEEGAWHEGEREYRTVHCNSRTIGLAAYTSILDMGLRVDAQVQVKAIDYNGEDQVIYHGDELEVLYVTGGSTTRILSLGKRIGNAV